MTFSDIGFTFRPRRPQRGMCRCCFCFCPRPDDDHDDQRPGDDDEGCNRSALHLSD